MNVSIAETQDKNIVTTITIVCIIKINIIFIIIIIIKILFIVIIIKGRNIKSKVCHK